jgi:uncharacterized LabA/DUF88 family protein
MSTDSAVRNNVRVMVFVDFWNFQISVNTRNPRFPIDWRRLGLVLAQASMGIVDPDAQTSYEGINVYGSYDPYNEKDKDLFRWATHTLGRFPGVRVTMIERQRKLRGPICPSCHEEMSVCPTCSADMRGTEEKGVDTRIATDMIKLAWVDTYDVAVLVSSDRDFVPVVEFLGTRGIKVIHATFPPQGSLLSQARWANIAIPSLMQTLKRS